MASAVSPVYGWKPQKKPQSRSPAISPRVERLQVPDSESCTQIGSVFRGIGTIILLLELCTLTLALTPWPLSLPRLILRSSILQPRIDGRLVRFLLLVVIILILARSIRQSVKLLLLLALLALARASERRQRPAMQLPGAHAHPAKPALQCHLEPPAAAGGPLLLVVLAGSRHHATAPPARRLRWKSLHRAQHA